MSFSHVYSVPAYYPNFRCKTGDCRHPCCTGWDIAISMQEYFRMIGLDCSPDLRRRLDTAFHLSDTPSEDRYAIISRRWDGDCPLHLPNGLCGLQCECGEDAIPSVCRYYPRSPKTRYAYQCQCSNSCEAVIELLFDYQEPMTFTRQKLTFRFSESVHHEHAPITKLFPHMQRACIHVLQNRAHPLSQRLIHLGELTRVMDIPYCQGNIDGIRAVLPFSATSIQESSAENTSSLRDKDLRLVLTCARDLLCWVEENNVSLQDHAKSALDLLKMSPDEPISEQTITLWRQFSNQMAAQFPDNDRMLEQVLVNHLCYDSFPLCGDHRNLWDGYLAFCTAYLLLRVLSACHLAIYDKETSNGTLTPTQAYADIVATLFRMVSHTNFAHNAAILAHRFQYDKPQMVFLFCHL